MTPLPPEITAQPVAEPCVTVRAAAEPDVSVYERLVYFDALGTPAPWRPAKMADAASRESMLASLREEWICGPNSVADECLFVLGNEAPDDPVTACVTGNGPKRHENTHLIAAMRNALPDFLRLLKTARKLVDEQRRYGDVNLATICELEARVAPFVAEVSA